jgi:radical SAM-linked protein
MGGCTNCGVCSGAKTILPQSEKRRTHHDTSRGMISDNTCCDRFSENEQSYHRIRVHFSKLGKGRFLSHLELMAVFSRALRRAKVPMRFSEGFHPLPRIILGPALAVGIESRSEYMDLEIQGAVDCCDLTSRLNREVPEWLRVLVAKEIPLKFPSISDSIISSTYVFSLKELLKDHFLDSGDLDKRLHVFRSNDTNYLEIKRKSGSSRIDLNQWIDRVHLEDETALEVTIKMSGGKTVGPYEVLRAILELKPLEKEKVLVVKTGEEFRVGPFRDFSTVEPSMVN